MFRSKFFPAHTQIEAECPVEAFTDIGTVVCVNDSVAVYIYEADIARYGCRFAVILPCRFCKPLLRLCFWKIPTVFISVEGKGLPFSGG